MFHDGEVFHFEQRHTHKHFFSWPTGTSCELQGVISSPLLLVQQREEWAPGDVLGDDGKLAGVIQTSPDKMDDTGVIEATEDGHLSAEHVYVWLRAVCVGSIAAEESRECIKKQACKHGSFTCVLNGQVPFDGDNFVSAFAPVDSPKGAWERNRYDY